MILPAASIESFLDVPDPSFQWVADTLHEELITSPTVPALSDTIMKLWATVEDEGASMPISKSG